jgi:L-iditol 2-dehydrogenase
MKALVLTRPNCFALEDWPLPAIGPDDVLIRVAACGICGSDVHGMDGSTARRQPPIVMGHEAAGTIAQVGDNVQAWAVGDRVTFDSTIFCAQCSFCRRGQVNLCDDRRVLGVSCDDYRQHGAFAEYVAVPQHILVRLPDAVNFRHAAMIEPLTIAYHAARRAKVTRDDTAVVMGAGVIGLLTVQMLRAVGCGQIIAVDLDQGRLDLARQLGANEAIRADLTDVTADVLQKTDGRGADLVLEAVGTAPTVQTAIACTRKGGQVTLVGNLVPSVELPLQAIVTRELTLRGSCASAGEYPACLEMLAQETVQVEPLISATAPLAEGPSWFHRLHQREPGLLKVILEP